MCKACLNGGRWEREREISPDPGQLWGLSWSGGLHLLVPGGLSLSSFSLSLSVQLDVQKPLNPPTQPPPSGSRPVLPSHAWPSLGIHSGCFLFIASTRLSLSLLYLSHQPPQPPPTHPSNPAHLRVFAICPINDLCFLSIFPCWNLFFSNSCIF